LVTNSGKVTVKVRKGWLPPTWLQYSIKYNDQYHIFNEKYGYIKEDMNVYYIINTFEILIPAQPVQMSNIHRVIKEALSPNSM
jgi:hypothetical protein